MAPDDASSEGAIVCVLHESAVAVRGRILCECDSDRRPREQRKANQRANKATQKTQKKANESKNLGVIYCLFC